MVIFAFAVPGRFGEWCDAIIRRLAEKALGTVLPIPAQTPEQLASDLINAEGSHFLVTGPQPGPWLFQLLKSTNRPFTIALNDPRDAALEMINRHGLDIADAVRRVSNSCASMMSCIALPEALVLNANRDWHDPLATAALVARHFGLSVTPAEIEAIVCEVAATELNPAWPAPENASDPAADAVSSIVKGAVAPYVEHFLGAPFGPLTWARELVMADGHAPALHAVDITGRVRALLYGPYISVPPGNWTAEIVLGFSQETADVNFLVDLLVGGKQLSATNIQPNREGIYSINLSFIIDEGNSHPLEFRVINEKPAFDGKVALGQITLTLHQDLPHMGTALRQELGLTA